MNRNVVAELAKAVGDAVIDVDRERLDDASHDSWPVSTKWLQSGDHPFPADVVVRASTDTDVCAVLAVAARHRVPVTARGRGSSVTGSPLPTFGGIVLDLSGLLGPADLDETNLTVAVPAGVCGGDLERWLNDRGYSLGNSPQSLDRSSVGGWLATREAGQFSSLYGGIEDLVVGIEAVLASGRPVSLSAAPRGAVGPDMRQLFIGSEGTLGIITRVTLKVFPLAEHRIVEAFRLADVASGVEAMRAITRNGLRPMVVRFYDRAESRKTLTDDSFDGCVLYLAHEGRRSIAREQHATAAAIVADAGGCSMGPGPVEQWMRRRFDFSAIERILAAPGGYAETIEVAQTWSRMLPLYAALRSALRPLADEVLGHFSHVYPQGTSLYVIVTGHVSDDHVAVERLHAVWRAAMETAIDHGAEISHHHGAGMARAPYVGKSRPDAIAIFREVKTALDPLGILNPGKFGL